MGFDSMKSGRNCLQMRGLLPLSSGYIGHTLSSFGLPAQPIVVPMAIQNLTAIENMLSQMRQVAQAAGSLPVRTDAVTDQQGGFAAELARSLSRVSEIQNTANAQAQAFQAGEPDVSLNDVMVDMQKAGIAFQATLQVRNRLIQAYQEIASMPV